MEASCTLLLTYLPTDCGQLHSKWFKVNILKQSISCDVKRYLYYFNIIVKDWVENNGKKNNLRKKLSSPDEMFLWMPNKLDGVGPVDNRPSIHRLAPPLCPKKRRRKKRKKCDMWHLTCDMWWGVNILSKFELSSSHGLGVIMLWRFGGKGWLINY